MPVVSHFRRGGGSLVDYDSSELALALERLRDAGADVAAETMPVLAEILVSAVHEVFEREGAVAGRPRWPDLAASTRRKRAKRQPSGVFKILQDTGVLAGSIMPHADQAVAEAFTNVPYAGFHISDAPRRVIPKRDFTDIDFDAAADEAVEVILAQVLDTAAE
jgi:phage gpG-like protein